MSVVNSQPFDLGERAACAVLCLHGLTGTPYEVRPLGEELARRGFRAVGPVLPGHDSTPEDLARLPYAAWVDRARSELEGLRGEHDHVFAVGLSMGGLVTLALAAEGGPEAIVAVGTPLRFMPPIPQLLPLAKRLMPMLKKKTGSDIRDPAARERHPGYAKMPLHSVHELTKLQRVVRQGLSRIRVPALIAHGAKDRTANPRDARTLHKAIPGSELMLLEKSGHVVPVDYDGKALAEAIGEFLERHVQP